MRDNEQFSRPGGYMPPAAQRRLGRWGMAGESADGNLVSPATIARQLKSINLQRMEVIQETTENIDNIPFIVTTYQSSDILIRVPRYKTATLSMVVRRSLDEQALEKLRHPGFTPNPRLASTADIVLKNSQQQERQFQFTGTTPSSMVEYVDGQPIPLEPIKDYDTFIVVQDALIDIKAALADD